MDIFICDQRIYATVLVCLITTFLFSDQNLLAPNMSAIADDFHFTEQEKDWKLGGQLAFGFFLLGAPVSLLVGHLADITNRCVLFAIVVAAGETSCLLTYWTVNYTQLFILRSLSGISIGGAVPIIFSMLADYYPGDSRVTVSTMIGIAMSVGISGGQIFAGIIGPIYGWRLPFLLVPIPAIFCAILLVTTTREPERGSQEDYILSIEESLENCNLRSTKPKLPETDRIKSLRNLITTPSVLICYLQGIPGCIPWGIIYVFLNDYLSFNRGLSITAASAVIFTFGIGGIFGQLFGGFIGQLLYNSFDKRFQCIFMGISAIIGVFPLLYLINGPVSPKYLSLLHLISFFGGFVAFIPGPNVRSVLQNVSSPETRGTAFAVFNLTDDVGKGGGPLLVALLISACGSRKTAFNIGVSLGFICGVLQCVLAFTVIKDENAVQDRIRQAHQQPKIGDTLSEKAVEHVVADVTSCTTITTTAGIGGTQRIINNITNTMNNNNISNSNHNRDGFTLIPDNDINVMFNVLLSLSSTSEDEQKTHN